DFSAGISIYPEHGEHVDLLTLRAELALKSARLNQNVYAIFEFEPDASLRMNELEFMGDFKKALNEDQFVIYFQPKIRLSDSKISGAEILSRWNHPERGILSPDSFLPMAEEMNLFRAFSRLLINKSFSMIYSLSQKYNVHFAVNLSPYNLLESDFIEFMKSSLEYHKVKAENVTLEITETGMMLDRDLSHKVMNELAGLGFSLAVDDFGIGYTSLSYLQGLPLHELKIDRTFIKDIHKNYNNSVIVKSLILLGQSLGMYITAEGVECREEMEILKKYGCNLVQGYFFSKPLSYDNFDSYLEKNL
ncbi:MAG: EAL domain-containing protein, partial [Spirochaetia bacterium]|nr:EAL domain-containing protein [Spirochaetia bacterium]